ncbi:hypothetical protein LCGC14_1216850, partial [marine sediment metagenome]
LLVSMVPQLRVSRVLALVTVVLEVGHRLS